MSQQSNFYDFVDAYNLPEGAVSFDEIDPIEAGTGTLVETPSGETVLLLLQRSWSSGDTTWVSFQQNIVDIIDGWRGVEPDTRVFVLDSRKATITLRQFKWRQFVNGRRHDARPKHNITHEQRSVPASRAKQTHGSMPSEWLPWFAQVAESNEARVVRALRERRDD